jgi:hypothetical protein
LGTVQVQEWSRKGTVDVKRGLKQFSTPVPSENTSNEPAKRPKRICTQSISRKVVFARCVTNPSANVFNSSAKRLLYSPQRRLYRGLTLIDPSKRRRGGRAMIGLVLETWKRGNVQGGVQVGQGLLSFEPLSIPVSGTRFHSLLEIASLNIN